MQNKCMRLCRDLALLCDVTLVLISRSQGNIGKTVELPFPPGIVNAKLSVMSLSFLSTYDTVSLLHLILAVIISLVDVYKFPCHQDSGLCRFSLLPLEKPKHYSYAG